MKNILIIGSGLIGKVHARLCNSNANANLVGFVVSCKSKYSSLSREFDCAIFESLKEALAHCNIDGVIIASPNALHLSHFIDCLDVGLPAIIEKPVFTDVNILKHIPQQFKNLKTFSRYIAGHHRLYGNILRQAKHSIDAGVVGQVRMFNGESSWYKPEHYFKEGTWRTSECTGGGVLNINLIHDVATIEYLLGKITEVSAFSCPEIREYEVEDTIVVNFKLKSGAIGSYSISDIAPSDVSWEYNSGENLAFPQQAQDCLKIFGTEACLKLPTNTIVKHKDEKNWWHPLEIMSPDVKVNDPLEEQLNQFLKLISGENCNVVSLLDGINFVSVIEAIKKSIKSGCSEYVQYYEV